MNLNYFILFLILIILSEYELIIPWSWLSKINSSKQKKIQYGKLKPKQGSTIYHVDIDIKNQISPTKIHIIRNVSFLIGELLFVPSEQKLVLTSATEILEKLDHFEIYSIDLENISALV